MTLAVKRLIRDVARRLPELAHVRPSRVLVVAGEARRASRASIRGLAPGPGRPEVALRGRRMLYVITLRPLWFRDSTPEERVATVLHELYHASTRFDGTLHRRRRHAELERDAYGRRVAALLQRYLEVAPPAVLSPFAFAGPARARMWLERPTARSARGSRRLYTEKQLFPGPVEVRSPAEARRRLQRPARALEEEEGS
jgi:predicted metallopeptidase